MYLFALYTFLKYLTQEHMAVFSRLEPSVFLYILSSTNESSMLLAEYGNKIIYQKFELYCMQYTYNRSKNKIICLTPCQDIPRSARNVQKIDK